MRAGFPYRFMWFGCVLRVFFSCVFRFVLGTSLYVVWMCAPCFFFVCVFCLYLVRVCFSALASV